MLIVSCSLYFALPAIEMTDVWTLMWVVVISDFTIKYATIICKAVVALLPRFIVRVHKKVGCCRDVIAC